MSRLYELADRYKTHQVKKDAMCCYLKSGGHMPVWVRLPPPAPNYPLIQGVKSERARWLTMQLENVAQLVLASCTKCTMTHDDTLL
jgi:hypothetical protein